MSKRLRTCVAALIAALASPALLAATLPLRLVRAQQDVVQLRNGQSSPLAVGSGIEAGTAIRTAAAGRAELSLAGSAAMTLGADTEVLLHDADRGVLKARLARGAVSIDTRSRSGGKAQDLRINAGEIRLRLMAAQGWIEQSEAGAQVCVLAGMIEAQVVDRAHRLELPGQCLRRSGISSQWTMVPAEVLSERVALTRVPEPAAAASAPTPVAAPAAAPALWVTAAPTPATPAPTAVVVVPAEPPAPPVHERVPAMVSVTPLVMVDSPDPAPATAAPALVAPEPAAAELAVPAAPGPAAAAVRERPAPVALPPLVAVVEVVGDADVAAPPVSAPQPHRLDLSLPVASASAPAQPREPLIEIVGDGDAAASQAAPAPEPAPAPPAGAPRLDPSVPAPAPVAAAEPPKEIPVEVVGDAGPPAPAVPETEPVAETVVAVAPPPPTVAPSASETPGPVTAAEPAAPVEPAAPDDGRRWSVVLASLDEREKADKEAERFRALGLEAVTREYRVGDRHGFRVGIGRFDTREQADLALSALKVEHPGLSAWAARY